jgi:hypothetical protein
MVRRVIRKNGIYRRHTVSRLTKLPGYRDTDHLVSEDARVCCIDFDGRGGLSASDSTLHALDFRIGTNLLPACARAAVFGVLKGHLRGARVRYLARLKQKKKRHTVRILRIPVTPRTMLATRGKGSRKWDVIWAASKSCSTPRLKTVHFSVSKPKCKHLYY